MIPSLLLIQVLLHDIVELTRVSALTDALSLTARELSPEERLSLDTKTHIPVPLSRQQQRCMEETLFLLQADLSMTITPMSSPLQFLLYHLWTTPPYLQVRSPHSSQHSCSVSHLTYIT